MPRLPMLVSVDGASFQEALTPTLSMIPVPVMMPVPVTIAVWDLATGADAVVVLLPVGIVDGDGAG